jgi:hypothetical protein
MMSENETAAIKALRTARDLETVPITRGQLVELLSRVHRAEGMKVEQAENYARMLVDHWVYSLRSDR